MTGDNFSGNRGIHEIDLVHVKIEGELNYSSKTFTASSSLTIKFGNEAKELLLGAANFSIFSIKLDDESAAYNYDMNTIHIKIPQKYRGKEVTVHVNYIVTDPDKGLHFVTKDKYGPYVQDQAWSTGEGQTKHFEVEEENSYWFPNIPGPETKCTSETIITVPGEQEVISNGDLISVVDLGEKRRYHWKMNERHSTYLISMAAGEFDSKIELSGKVKLMYYVPRGRKQDIDRVFSCTKEFLEFFGNYTGFPYPFNKFAQTCVYGAAFGGMENTTANTMTERMLHDERAHIDYNYEENVGHHMAHQWFGDIVTCKSWEDVWLNESFAIFAYALYLENRHCENDYLYYCLEKIDSLTETRHILGGEEVCSTYSENPKQSFGRYNIEKGSIVINSLRNILGKELFREGIVNYFSRFKFGAASTKDLQEIMEETSGQELSWFFNEFVYSKGFPRVSVNYSFSERDKVVLIKFDQKQQIRRAFRLRFKVFIRTDEGKTVEETVELSDQKETVAAKCNSSPKFVCVDPDQSIVGKIELEENVEKALAKIESDTHLICRIRAIRSLRGNARNEVLNALKNVLSNAEEHWSMASEAALVLGSTYSEESFNILKMFSKHRHPKVRKSVVSSLGEFKTKESYELLKSLLGDEKSYYVLGEIHHSLGKTGIPGALDILIEGLNQYSHGNAIAIGSIRGMSKIGTEQAAGELLKVAQFSLAKELRLAAVNELFHYLGYSDVKLKILNMIEDKDQEISDASLGVALKSSDPDFINEAKDKFLARYFTDYSMTWLA